MQNVLFGTPSDIEAWMDLVNQVSWNFPGLEAQEKIEEHKETVLRFMSKKQALCMKDGKEVIGVILFSRKHNMIFGFVEDELIEEFGYPNQKFVKRRELSRKEN